MPSSVKDPYEQLAREARFVFRGTVQKLNAANLTEVHDTSKTAIVRVDEIIQAPKVLSLYAGREITVELAPRARLNAGDEAVFFTNAWLFGNEGVAVRSLAHRPPGRQVMALHAPDRNPVTNLADRDTRAHYDDADLAVSGRVTTVRLPGQAQGIPSTREHDPDWREAVVEVDRVYKGKIQKKQIIVMFPASQDRQWHHAPKLQAGYRGHFLLHRHKEAVVRGKKVRAATRAAARGIDKYAVLHSEDFEPEEHPGRLEKLLSAKRGAKPRK
jgi:hypothetical protein